MTQRHPELTVREATAHDLALVSDIHVRSRVATYRGQVADHYLDVTVPATSLAMWEERLPGLLAGEGKVLIAQADDTPIAFGCALAPDADASVYVNNLHALPGHKGLGAGTALLAAIQAWARTLGARSLHLKVLETNRAAIGFYESRGWRCTGVREDDWAGMRVNMRLYAVDLT